MSITLKFVGALRRISFNEKITIGCKKETSVRELISQLNGELRNSIIDEQFGARVNTLILINGREISALDGLETIIHDGDKLVFVPVVHGG